MRVLVLLLLFAAVGESTNILELVEKQLNDRKASTVGATCDLNDLIGQDELIECDETDDSLVPHGARCKQFTPSRDQFYVALCIDGWWVPAGTLSDTGSLHREKRFIGALVGAISGIVSLTANVVGIVCAFGVCDKEDSGGGSGSTQYIVKKSPTYSNCPPSNVLPIYYADKGETSVAVTWSKPKANDEDGSIVKNTQTSSPLNGGKFQGTTSTSGLRNPVTYETVDNDGLKGYCNFYIPVKVRSCPTHPWPKNGHLVCDKANIYGSMCNTSCSEGFELTGDDSTTCMEHGSWTETPVCTKIKCSEPSKLTNGNITCDDPAYSFQSVCSYTCNKGFSLKGPVFIQCQANRLWSLSDEQICKDAEPPVLQCLSPQTFYADRGVLTTPVSWQEPTAKDTLDPNPSITQTEGPSLGDVLSTGSKTVAYIATDVSGNISPPCQIELRVQEITCTHPLDSLDDKNMLFDCSDSSYYYGVSCHLSCDFNFPLEGSAYITCETMVGEDAAIGQWDWGDDDRPHCREIDCPDLNAPINGALSRDSVNQRPLVILNCNKNYDIPYLDAAFNGQISCLDSGTWVPVNVTPDCIEPYISGRMKLPSELYYYVGDDCPEEEIKQNFLTIISDMINPLYNTICPSEITCTVEYVTVTCGPISSRRKKDLTESYSYYKIDYKESRVKRETHVAAVLFDIVLTWPVGTFTLPQDFGHLDNLQIKQKQAIDSGIDNGTFEIANATLKPDSFLTAPVGNLDCNSGWKLRGFKCIPCARGMYLDDEQNKCEFCPVGQYMDTEGATSCEACPEGYSTLHTGSKLLSDCIKQCSPGYISPTSLEECELCPVGTYQDSVGMTTCTECPSGQTTAFPGSKYQNKCQNFDILLQGVLRDIALGNISSSESLSVVFWVKPFRDETVPSVILELSNGVETRLKINMSSSLSIDAGKYFDTGVYLTETKWIHVAIVVDERSLRLYINGEEIIDGTIDPLFLYSGYLFISSTDDNGLYISGLHVVERSLTVNDITMLLSSCTESVANSVISMDSFLKLKYGGVKIITPGVCDAVDECVSSPCGEHGCMNEVGDFRCICSNGMTGRQCEIPPDHCIDNECKNGATCENHGMDYSCTCLPGYSGTFCENPPVNGGWSDFREWSACSKSCDGGNRIRSRTCDNPQPGVGGLDCSGPTEEKEGCNVYTCKECGEPRRGFGIIPNCTTDEETNMRQCSPYCRDGTEKPSGLEQFKTYRCGNETSYEWTPLDKFPACVDPAPPRRYSIEVVVDYNSEIPSSSKEDVESTVTDSLSMLDCKVQTTQCEVTASLDSSATRRKRDIVSKLIITLSIPISADGDLDIDGYLSSNSVSPALQEIVDAIVALSSTAASIQTNASALLDVLNDGITYSVTESTWAISIVIDCLEGSVATGGICLECPVGTNANSGQCLYCDVGRYQDETGQTSCKSCPSGYSTSIIGASDISECTETIGVIMATTETTQTGPGNRRDAAEGSPSLKSGMVAGIAIGSTGVVLALTAIVCYVCKIPMRKTNRAGCRSNSFIDINVVRPTPKPDSVANTGHRSKSQGTTLSEVRDDKIDSLNSTIPSPTVVQNGPPKPVYRSKSQITTLSEVSDDENELCDSTTQCGAVVENGPNETVQSLHQPPAYQQNPNPGNTILHAVTAPSEIYGDQFVRSPPPPYIE